MQNILYHHLQCMKFSAKTVMKTATFQDLATGYNQGTMVEFPLAGFVDHSSVYAKHTAANVATYIFLSSAILIFGYTLWTLKKFMNKSRVLPTLRAALLGQR